jgi:hypothetical protein
MNPQSTSTISPLVLHGRVAFVSFNPGGVTIDGVIGSAASPDVDGIITLRASLPYSAWAMAAAALLESWADADTPVELRFRYTKPNPQVTISDQQAQRCDSGQITTHGRRYALDGAKLTWCPFRSLAQR